MTATCDENVVACTSDRAEHGINMIRISSVDTHVVVSLAEKLGCACIWFAFGSDTTFSYVDSSVSRSW